jgi:REP element-mobilizing transposase RayT
MSSRESEPPLPDPLAYFITWSTYGTWLPGDKRGWVEYHRGWQLPDPIRELEARAKMREDACILDIDQRREVEAQIEETCRIRGWTLHAVNCRSNHVHIVVSANQHPKRVRSQIKAWCTQRLKALEKQRYPGLLDIRENWWAERGSQRWIFNDVGLEGATLYVRDGQDGPRFNPKR